MLTDEISRKTNRPHLAGPVEEQPTHRSLTVRHNETYTTIEIQTIF